MKIDLDLRMNLSCEEVGDCVHWRSDAKSELRKRHPLISVDGKVSLVRRVLWERTTGKTLGAGDYLMPRCKDPYCIKPQHQRVVDMKAKNAAGCKAASKSLTRAAKVQATKRARGQMKLTPEQVEEARHSNETHKALAAKFDCNPSVIWRIRIGKAHRNYSNPFAGMGARL